MPTNRPTAGAGEPAHRMILPETVAELLGLPLTAEMRQVANAVPSKQGRPERMTALADFELDHLRDAAHSLLAGNIVMHFTHPGSPRNLIQMAEHAAFLEAAVVEAERRGQKGCRAAAERQISTLIADLDRPVPLSESEQAMEIYVADGSLHLEEVERAVATYLGGDAGDYDTAAIARHLLQQHGGALDRKLVDNHQPQLPRNVLLARGEPLLDRVAPASAHAAFRARPWPPRA